MERTRLDRLFATEPPWLHVRAPEPESLKMVPSSFYSRESVRTCVRVLRGRKMRTAGDLMTEFGAALQFFDGFGENWPSLEECLCYLDEWLEADGYLLLVPDADQVLCEEQAERGAFWRTMDRACRWWSVPVEGNGRFDRPARPFHVLLETATEPDRLRLVRSARESGIDLQV